MDQQYEHEHLLLRSISDVLRHGTVEEREILQLALQAIEQKRTRGSAYMSGFLGLKGDFKEDGSYRFEVPVTPFMLNRAGIVFGGITASLLDSTMGSLINRSLPTQQYAVTLEMKVNYVAPGKGKKLISTARFLHRGSKTCVAAADIVNEKDVKIVTGMGTFYVLNQSSGDK